jgi:SWI/SNF-related matrix-associated actin-dependent regulator of chromatin subfamily A-like protein 1
METRSPNSDRIVNDPQYKRLYGFQRHGVHFLMDRKYALLADEVGVGKTPQVITAARLLNLKDVLVICPASIKYDWADRLEAWGWPRGNVHVIDTKNVKTESLRSLGVFVVNYDIIWRKNVAKYLAGRAYDLLICDESHFLKGSGSKRTKAVFGARGYKSRSQRVWFMTGTPILNRPEELYTTLRYLVPERLEGYQDYIAYTRRYCNGHDGAWGWVAEGATNLEELSEKLEGFMLRRERDVLPELPDKIMRLVHVERTDELDRLIFEQHADPQVKSVRQKIGLAKMKEVIAYVKDLLSAEDKIVVFTYHHSMIDGLYEGLEKFNPVRVTGESSAKLKHSLVKQFMTDDKCRVFIGQIEAIGTGVDGLQGVARHAVFAEISYVPGINQQAMGRLHRNGQKQKTIFDFITVRDSLDENIIEKNLFKSEVVQKLMKDENNIFSFNHNTEVVMPENEEVILTVKLKTGFDDVKGILKALAAIESMQVYSCDMSVVLKTDEVEVEKPKTKVKKKPEAPKTEDVFPADDAPFGTEEAPTAPAMTKAEYGQFIRKAANAIQSTIKDKKQAADALTEINTRFKKLLPNRQHALMVDEPGEQRAVVEMITGFLAEKKVTL